jgi:hypothetical protein
LKHGVVWEVSEGKITHVRNNEKALCGYGMIILYYNISVLPKQILCILDSVNIMQPFLIYINPDPKRNMKYTAIKYVLFATAGTSSCVVVANNYSNFSVHLCPGCAQCRHFITSA